MALFALGRQLAVEGRHVEAEPALRRALDVAESIDAHAVRATALAAMGVVLSSLGRVDDGIAAADEAVTIAEAHGTADDLSLVYVNVTVTYVLAGRYDDVVRLAVAGLEHARRCGMLAAGGALLTGSAAEALCMLGRWDEALAMVAADRSAGDGFFGMDGAIVAARIALWRGRIEDAIAHAGRARRRRRRGQRLRGVRVRGRARRRHRIVRRRPATCGHRLRGGPHGGRRRRGRVGVRDGGRDRSRPDGSGTTRRPGSRRRRRSGPSGRRRADDADP